MTTGKAVPLDTYPNEMEALMTAQLLESVGIAAFVKPMGGGYGALGVTQFIHHRVYVQERDVDEARKMLDEIVVEAASDAAAREANA
ncbi:MAG: DUF2007 domain-containing protein [Chloroflexi bacterium]|nr:DUF2007 domain-containing protein [Chloroflexota bacterium]